MSSGDVYIFLVEQPQYEFQLIDILDYLLAASICCHRDRHRWNAVVHALRPTRGLCLKADLNFCVLPSGGRLGLSGPNLSHHFFSDNFFLRVSKFSDQLLL